MERQKSGILSYLKVLQTKYQNKIMRVTLFGSAAKGESDLESDIDILVVVRDEYDGLCDEISMAAFDSILEHDVIISPIVMESKTYEWHKKYKDPLYNSIERDGIEIWMKIPESLLKSV
ncbi:MAG: Nucleotidyltransferase domain protein [Candidatus Scalindua rubra]|uniref:Nucleotidyltransferase domain protein n=1 Tax=Candidatus Scalindua rubra TaxID=1872076 RepID=A0A1E3XCN6_9BACT|nr:MAG: Nucleotidyltransferase domain protein [Candidatus Scalindua rubra]